MTTTREAALEAALKLARNRLQACAIDYPTGSREMAERSEWADEATAALSTPATEPQGYVDGLEAAVLKHLTWFERFICDRDELDSSTPRKVAENAKDAAIELRVALASRPAPQPAAEPETDPVWIAGNEFALGRLCAVLGVNPDQVVWDGSDGSLNEEADGLIWRIVEASGYTQPAADTPALDDELATMISDLSHTGELSMLYRMEIADRITALRAALDAAEARAVGVKPLMWVQRKDYLWAAESLCGMIYITEYAGSQTPLFLDIPGCRKDAYHPTLEAAKAAAQADYEARILSAIIGNATPTPSDKIAEAAIDRCMQEIEDIICEADVSYPAGRDAGTSIDFDRDAVLAALRALAGKGE